MNFPIVDGILAGKVYAMYRHSDDYAENLVPGVSDLGGGEVTTFRGALRLTPSDNIDWYVSADYTHRDNSTAAGRNAAPATFVPCRSEEHTSELQSLMRISYAVFCLKKKK